jgi:hypothetical protein
MHGKLGRREREDEPAAACIDEAKPEHILEETAIRVGVPAVDDGMSPVDHGLEVVVTSEFPASVVIPAPEVVIASTEVVAAEVALVSAIALARASGGKGRDEATQRVFAAMGASRVGRRIALKQR